MCKFSVRFSKSLLVGLSLLFILIIVVELSGNKFSSLSIDIPDFYIIKGAKISLASALLCILSIFIAILSGFIVCQKDKEKKRKQREMVYEIEVALKELYEKGE